MARSIDRGSITGLVLAGGRGSRMGGVDKGLVVFAGRPMVEHAIERLQPQVSAVLVNANRSLERYRSFGVRVVSDATDGCPGPLAGLQAGLADCSTPWLATIPCDSPCFPLDLVARLSSALINTDAEIAVVQTTQDGRSQPQPVFMLVSTVLRPSLDAYLLEGGRKVGSWLSSHRRVDVRFEDAGAFANVNSPDELAALERVAGEPPRGA